MCKCAGSCPARVSIPSSSFPVSLVVAPWSSSSPPPTPDAPPSRPSPSPCGRVQYLLAHVCSGVLGDISLHRLGGTVSDLMVVSACSVGCALAVAVLLFPCVLPWGRKTPLEADQFHTGAGSGEGGPRCEKGGKPPLPPPPRYLRHLSRSQTWIPCGHLSGPASLHRPPRRLCLCQLQLSRSGGGAHYLGPPAHVPCAWVRRVLCLVGPWQRCVSGAPRLLSHVCACIRAWLPMAVTAAAPRSARG
jgi:hypothetical protein